MLERILFPLDGSYLTIMALDAATRVLTTDCELVLLRAIPAPDSDPTSSGVDNETALKSAVVEAEHYLSEVAETLRKQGFRPRTRIDVGEPGEVIIRAARELDADMIMMSAHGRTGIRPGLCSQITQRVLQTAACPVLVISNGQADLLDDDILD